MSSAHDLVQALLGTFRSSASQSSDASTVDCPPCNYPKRRRLDTFSAESEVDAALDLMQYNRASELKVADFTPVGGKFSWQELATLKRLVAVLVVIM